MYARTHTHTHTHTFTRTHTHTHAHSHTHTLTHSHNKTPIPPSSIHTTESPDRKVLIKQNFNLTYIHPPHIATNYDEHTVALHWYLVCVCVCVCECVWVSECAGPLPRSHNTSKIHLASCLPIIPSNTRWNTLLAGSTWPTNTHT